MSIHAMPHGHAHAHAHAHARTQHPPCHPILSFFLTFRLPHIILISNIFLSKFHYNPPYCSLRPRLSWSPDADYS